MSPEQLQANPWLRVADINAAFADRSIAGIIASIGGDDSIRILPYLDREIIEANPKLIMGYSDTTTLLAFINTLGNVTFHGPAVMAGIAQAEALGPEYLEDLNTFLLSNPETYEYYPSAFYVNGYPDWGIAQNRGKINTPIPNPGWYWLQKASCKTATVWGGCMDVLEFMKGTDFWPERVFFDDKFLLFETSEDVPTPQQVLYFLRNYETQTILNRIQGIIFGRPRDYTPQQNRELRQVVTQVVIEECGRTDIPILMDFDAGHTDPQRIVPFGIRMEIDSENSRVVLVEKVFDEE